MSRPVLLSTPRLRLVAPDARLEACAGLRDGSLERELGAPAARDWPPPFAAETLGFWREALERDPALVGWTAWYWTLREATAPPRLVGFGGFCGAPSAGTVEIGYSVVESEQGRGLATEACSALIVWASCDARVERIVAHTLDLPGPSRRVLAKLGFREAGPGGEPGTLRHELELG